MVGSPLKSVSSLGPSTRTRPALPRQRPPCPGTVGAESENLWVTVLLMLRSWSVWFCSRLPSAGKRSAMACHSLHWLFLRRHTQYPATAASVLSMAGLSRDQQVKAVVEGLALGALALGVEAVSASKMSLEFAIGRSLRSWSYASEFPSLGDRLGPNYVWLGFGKSERRQMAYAAWSDGRWLVPYILMDGWSVEDCTEILGEHGPVPHDGWVELASLFVGDLGDDKVRRS